MITVAKRRYRRRDDRDMSAGTADRLDGRALGARLGRIVGSANVEVRPTALIPYRTDATLAWPGLRAR
jgi:hypothetical protein